MLLTSQFFFCDNRLHKFTADRQHMIILLTGMILLWFFILWSSSMALSSMASLPIKQCMSSKSTIFCWAGFKRDLRLSLSSKSNPTVLGEWGAEGASYNVFLMSRKGLHQLEHRILTEWKIWPDERPTFENACKSLPICEIIIGNKHSPFGRSSCANGVGGVDGVAGTRFVTETWPNASWKTQVGFKDVYSKENCKKYPITSVIKPSPEFPVFNSWIFSCTPMEIGNAVSDIGYRLIRTFKSLLFSWSKDGSSPLFYEYVK